MVYTLIQCKYEGKEEGRGYKAQDQNNNNKHHKIIEMKPKIIILLVSLLPLNTALYKYVENICVTTTSIGRSNERKYVE